MCPVWGLLLRWWLLVVACACFPGLLCMLVSYMPLARAAVLKRGKQKRQALASAV